MSMTMLTISQFIKIFSAYTFVALLMPAFILRRKLQGRKTLEKWCFYFLCGNFYIMHIVFLLEFLHISNRWTLTLGTIIIAGYLEYRFNKQTVKEKLGEFRKMIFRLLNHQVGGKTFTIKYMDYGWTAVKNCVKSIAAVLKHNVVETVLFMVFFIWIMYFYGGQKLECYGYTASDIPVHLAWINGLTDNNIFVDGVYPFGFHNVVYYIHTVFNIDAYVVMRLMSLVQVIYINLMLYGFMKLVCKSRYLPYAGMFIFAIGGYFRGDTYVRYNSSLPQEFGMLFILPAIYFAMNFFDERRSEIKKMQMNGDKQPEKKSYINLVGFAMSFAMTLIVHFYGTMIAGLFGVAVACGYIGCFFRKYYFKQIIVTISLSLFVAIFPMAFAFATGTPLQGSLNWGMSVIKGDVENEEETEEETEEEASYNENEGNYSETDNITTSSFNNNGKINRFINMRGSLKINTFSYMENATVNTSVENQQSIPDDGKSDKRTIIEKITDAVNLWIFENGREWYFGFLVVCGIILIISGTLSMCFKENEYGCKLYTFAVFFAIMLILQSAENLNIPALMDANRCSIYFTYIIPIIVVAAIDSVCFTIEKAVGYKRIKHILSFVIALVILVDCILPGHMKKQKDMESLEMNEAIICLSNIIREEADNTWIICSANDETQMVKGHGWHYEISTLLEGMEYYREEIEIRLQAKTIYFFVEKKPLQYDQTIQYDDAGQMISEEGAKEPLPQGGGLLKYQGRNRWIMMSRMYAWAQKFRKLYPNEMSVYMETDNFICYKLKQNEYCLYNLAIDYGYNQYVQ